MLNLPSEWGAQYDPIWLEVRMEELQLELEETQRQLDLVKALTLLATSFSGPLAVPGCPGCQARLQESEKLEEKARTGHSVAPSCGPERTWTPESLKREL